MKQLRLWCAIFFGWLFVFYNIERLHAPINIGSFVYVLAAGASVPLIFFAQLQRIRSVWLIVPLVPLILVLKACFGYPIFGASLPMTITEVGAVLVTIVLARRIGSSLEDLRQSAVQSLIAHLNEKSRPFELGQSAMYREIRRARAFDRPLALLAVSAKCEAVDLQLDRFTQEVQQETVRNYIQARIAQLLTEETKDCDIITQCDGHFTALLPEASRDVVENVIERISSTSRERLGIELDFGVSIFPEDEVTFVRLLESAEADLHEHENDSCRGDRSVSVGANSDTRTTTANLRAVSG